MEKQCMDGTRRSVWTVIVMAGSACPVLAQYQAVTLGSLGGTAGASVACVNNNGEAVGVSDTNAGLLHAFCWTGTAMQDMGTLQGGITSRALWINNNGVAVGTSKNAAGQDRAVIWQRDALGVWQIN